IARLCCDTRRQVRSQALTYLQRALLVHDLQTLSAVEWEACFNKVSILLSYSLQLQCTVHFPLSMFTNAGFLHIKPSILQVLFPLLHKLLGTINPQDPNGIEETRMRASTLLCK
ncbi:unnamed protein product, partial [Owenia fusiformis]